MHLRIDGDDAEPGEMHEINVTPFIDVMLVLLIIFMIAAPLATVSVPVDLPATAAARTAEPDKPLVLTVKADLSLSLNGQPVSRDTLGAALDGAGSSDRGQRVYLRADKRIAYGELMNVMNAMRDAGYLNMALVGLEADKSP
jgi:TonB system transport protein ExbD (group 1)